MLANLDWNLAVKVLSETASQVKRMRLVVAISNNTCLCRVQSPEPHRFTLIRLEFKAYIVGIIGGVGESWHSEDPRHGC